MKKIKEIKNNGNIKISIFLIDLDEINEISIKFSYINLIKYFNKSEISIDIKNNIINYTFRKINRQKKVIFGLCE